MQLLPLLLLFFFLSVAGGAAGPCSRAGGGGGGGGAWAGAVCFLHLSHPATQRGGGWAASLV
ncbi:hypothetical protein DI494_22200, partial [Stenotrophomonas maltophilia]